MNSLSRAIQFSKTLAGNPSYVQLDERHQPAGLTAQGQVELANLMKKHSAEALDSLAEEIEAEAMVKMNEAYSEMAMSQKIRDYDFDDKETRKTD